MTGEEVSNCEYDLGLVRHRHCGEQMTSDLRLCNQPGVEGQLFRVVVTEKIVWTF